MTLIISVLTPTQVVQLSDRRRTGPNEEYVDTDHKSIVFCNHLSFSTAGAQFVAGYDSMLWLGFELLKLRDEPVEAVVDQLASNLDEIQAAAVVPHQSVGFFAAGWVRRNSDSEPRPYYCSISNFQVAFDEAFLDPPSSHFYRLTAAPADTAHFVVAPPDLVGLPGISHRLESELPNLDSDDPAAIAELLVACARLAETDPGISKALLINSIPKVSAGASALSLVDTVPHRDVPSHIYLPGPDDPAHVWSPYRVCPGLPVFMAPSGIHTSLEEAKASFDTIPFKNPLTTSGQAMRTEYDDFIARNRDNDSDIEIRERVALAMLGRAGVFVDRNRHEDALAVFDELLAYCPGDRGSEEIRVAIAVAMNNRGVALGRLNRHEEALGAFDAMIARYHDDDNETIRKNLAMAMRTRGLALALLDRTEEALEAFEEVIAGFSDEESDQVIREHLVMAMRSRGAVLARLGRDEEALKAFEDVIARYSDDGSAAIRNEVATAVYDRDLTLARLNHQG